ncbi:hypothetical protein [Streptomyces sp. NPDC057460]|uniref:phosphotriesterase family protein n=1 Tax=Streptomyces sp. NPDC057460 TaxID=3346141 RepID=UPI0036C7201A
MCDAHDHLFLRSPVLPGQELDDRGRAGERLRDFRGLGGRSVVQWTPYGMGRRADTLAAPVRSTGTHVVAATGLHQVAHYTPELLDRVRDGPADLLRAPESAEQRHAGSLAGAPRPPVQASAASGSSRTGCHASSAAPTRLL